MAGQETAPRSPHSRSGSETVLNASRAICRSTYELIREDAVRNPQQTAIVLPLSPARARLYPPTLVSSNAPRARSDAFCAAVRPRMPVISRRS